MKYLLDSNAWIALFRQSSPRLLGHLNLHAESDIALCSVVLGELWYGAYRSGPTNRARNNALIDQLRARYASLPIDDAPGKGMPGFGPTSPVRAKSSVPTTCLLPQSPWQTG